jgi:hypothetical protein
MSWLSPLSRNAGVAIMRSARPATGGRHVLQRTAPVYLVARQISHQQHVANTIWAYAKLPHTYARDFGRLEMLCKRALATDKEKEMTATEVIETLDSDFEMHPVFDFTEQGKMRDHDCAGGRHSTGACLWGLTAMGYGSQS